MSEENMIERVAKALCEADGYSPLELGEHYPKLARAALDAMREPSETMMDAAHEVPAEDVVGSYVPDGDYEYRTDDSPALIWRAMIDADLAEQPHDRPDA